MKNSLKKKIQRHQIITPGIGIMGMLKATPKKPEEPEVIDLEWLRRKIHEICKVPYHKNDKFNN